MHVWLQIAPVYTGALFFARGNAIYSFMTKC